MIMLVKYLCWFDIVLGALCLVVGLTTGDEDCLGAGIGMIGFFAIMWVLSFIFKHCNYQSNPRDNLDRKRQDDYDNCWGIIDWYDK